MQRTVPQGNAAHNHGHRKVCRGRLAAKAVIMAAPAAVARPPAGNARGVGHFGAVALQAIASARPESEYAMAFLSFSSRCLLSFTLIGVAACSDQFRDDDATEASALLAPNATTQRAYDVLSAGRVGELRQVLSELDSAAETRDDGYANFYAGAFGIWAIGSSSTVNDVFALPSLIQDSLKRLERGHQLLPNDFRATSFLALGQLFIGNAFGDQALITAGQRTFEQGFAQMPAYAHYLRACSLSGTNRQSDLFKMSLDDMRGLMKECAYPAGDGPYSYRYPSDPQAAPHPSICLNEGMVPHVWEGVFTTYGDLMVKAGDVAAGRALYQSVQTAPHYADWPYRSALEERLQNASTRAAQHADRNPLNDPVLWTLGPLICVGCHQKGGAPVR